MVGKRSAEADAAASPHVLGSRADGRSGSCRIKEDSRRSRMELQNAFSHIRCPRIASNWLVSTVIDYPSQTSDRARSKLLSQAKSRFGSSESLSTPKRILTTSDSLNIWRTYPNADRTCRSNLRPRRTCACLLPGYAGLCLSAFSKVLSLSSH